VAARARDRGAFIILRSRYPQHFSLALWPALMLSTRVAALIVAGSFLSLMPSAVRCQAATHGSAAAHEPTPVVSVPFAYAARAGIPPGLSEPASDARDNASPSPVVAGDSAHPSRPRSRAAHVVIGAVTGAIAGFVAGVLVDKTGKSGAPGDHVTYSFENYTTPTGALIGVVIGLLIPAS